MRRPRRAHSRRARSQRRAEPSRAAALPLPRSRATAPCRAAKGEPPCRAAAPPRRASELLRRRAAAPRRAAPLSRAAPLRRQAEPPRHQFIAHQPSLASRTRVAPRSSAVAGSTGAPAQRLSRLAYAHASLSHLSRVRPGRRRAPFRDVRLAATAVQPRAAAPQAGAARTRSPAPHAGARRRARHRGPRDAAARECVLIRAQLRRRAILLALKHRTVASE